MLQVCVDADLLIDRSTTSPPQGVHRHTTDRASELAEKLDCLPLALSQAAAFMKKNRLSIGEYLERMSAPSDEMVAERAVRPQPLEAQIGDPKSIYDTCRISFMPSEAIIVWRPMCFPSCLSWRRTRLCLTFSKQRFVRVPT